MHMVVCPHCHRTFRVPKPLTQARMRCGGCGQSFVGSSVEAPTPGGKLSPIGGPPPPPAPPPPAVRPAGRRAAGPLTLVICCVGTAGIIVLVGVFWWIRTHPTYVVKESTATPGAPRTRGPERVGTRREPGEIATTTAASQPSSRPREIPSDPELLVSRPKLKGRAIGDRKFACGSVINKYGVALGEVTVTAYVDGLRGPSRHYPYVPPGGKILYCIPLVGQELAADRIKVVAHAIRAWANRIVWEIPPEDVRRAPDPPPGTAVWTGRVRNPAEIPVSQVKIVLDYYDDEGVWGGRVSGELEDRPRLGPRGRGFFRVSTKELNALEPVTSSVVIARAVADTR